MSALLKFLLCGRDNGGSGIAKIVVVVMVTAVVRVVVVISSNFFSCSPHPFLPPTAS